MNLKGLFQLTQIPQPVLKIVTISGACIYRAINMFFSPEMADIIWIEQISLTLLNAIGSLKN